MNLARDRFLANLARTRDLLALCVSLNVTTAGTIDLTDILRAALVLAVSALDNYVHEITRIGMIEIYNGTRTRTVSYGKFSVTMDNVTIGFGTPGSVDWLEEEVRRQHGWLSFQHSDKIADAIRLISDSPIWVRVGAIIGTDARSAKNRLNLIIDRRNKIAHEADMDTITPGARWPIDPTLVQEAIDSLQSIALAIYDVVTTP